MLRLGLLLTLRGIKMRRQAMLSILLMCLLTLLWQLLLLLLLLLLMMGSQTCLVSKRWNRRSLRLRGL